LLNRSDIRVQLVDIGVDAPAALATILNAASVQVSPEDLVDRVYLHARQGWLQARRVLGHVRLKTRGLGNQPDYAPAQGKKKRSSLGVYVDCA